MGLGEDIVTKVYDINTHPYLMEDVCSTEEDLRFAVEITGLYKTGIFPMKANFNRLNCAKIDISVLSPLDLTTTRGRWFVTNEQTKKLQDTYPDRFLGMASVDPMRDDASVVLEHAFADLELSGLYLHPSLQKFYPDDERCEPIWNICEKYNKPILFDAGLSPYPNLLTKYAHPLRFEEIACRHPNLRICLSRFGWPWVRETAMLMMKYRNVYTDTSVLYLGTAPEMYHHILTVDMEKHWLDRSFRHQVMFGSGDPGLEEMRMIKAIKDLDVRDSTKELILGKNAEEFLGKEIHWYD